MNITTTTTAPVCRRMAATRTHENNVTTRLLIIIIIILYFLASEIGRRRNTATRVYTDYIQYYTHTTYTRTAYIEIAFQSIFLVYCEPRVFRYYVLIYIYICNIIYNSYRYYYYYIPSCERVCTV